MKEDSNGGASLCEEFHEGGVEGAKGNRKIRFLRECKMPCKRSFLSTGILLGNMEGVRLPRLLREKKVNLGSFLGPGGH
jgi:hypothetical protein